MYRSFLALRYIRSRFVNLISIGGVTLGVAVLMVVTSVMDGFQERVRSVLRGNLSHLVITPQTGDLPDLASFTMALKGADARIVGVAPQVAVPMGYFYDSGRRGGLRWDERALQVLGGVGIDWETEKRIEADLEKHLGAEAHAGAVRIVAANDPGDPFQSPRVERLRQLGAGDKSTVMVSRAFTYAFLLGVPVSAQPKPGSAEDLAALRGVLERDVQVELILPEKDASGQASAKHFGRSLVLSAVYDGGDQATDVTRLFFRRSDLVNLAGLKEPWQELRVWLSDYAAAQEVKRTIMARWPGVVAETWEEQREDFLRAVKTEKVLLVIVLSFIVLLGGFIILATLTLTVVEKTRDIGVLAALGATRSGILSIFLRNGFFIGVIGAALGLGLGTLLVHHINGIKDFFDARGIHLFPPDIYLFTEIPTVWSWPTVLTIVGGSVGVAFFAGLLPALRASRLDPVVALRHE